MNALLIRQAGLITWQQARRFLSEKTVRHRVRAGEWQRIHRGLYCARPEEAGERQMWWAASLAAGNGRPALLAGASALRVFGLRRFDWAGWPAGGLVLGVLPVHVLVHSSRPDRDPPDGVRVHRTRRLSSVDICPTVSPPCTTAARALVDAVEWAGDRAEAAMVLATVRRHRLVSQAQVRPVLNRLPRLSRRRLIEETVFGSSVEVKTERGEHPAGFTEGWSTGTRTASLTFGGHLG
ncbi:hypothetical protein L3i22_019320 [Actinoplanes sp. L3-i22]|nr:hypothetical protein L3i22_019320 [Actinoplanes sp. L3-i22]